SYFSYCGQNEICIKYLCKPLDKFNKMRYNNLEVKTYDKIEINRNLIPPWGGKQRRPKRNLFPPPPNGGGGVVI
ncbi:MAG: hypothetical protein IJM96_10035, partial [Clostridia bacterium]|nr:hypothetical protein [Clostridia bacterium]